MNDSLHWTKHLDLLQVVIAVPNLGIISDFDGTLSEFADTASEAIIAEENARALDQLAEHVRLVALVSGRAVADLRKRFERPWVRYYGSHGMDLWHNDQVQVVQTAQEWSLPLAKMLSEFTPPDEAGVWVENKGVTASVHYRLAANPTLMRERLREQLQPLCTRYGLVLSEGRYIWEIKPPISLSKGTAVESLIEDNQLDSVVFLGDDVTDLSAMMNLRTLRDEGRVQAVSVGVIHTDSEPAAMRDTCDITAHGPSDVARLLHWIHKELMT